jgi:hypothetical protein
MGNWTDEVLQGPDIAAVERQWELTIDENLNALPPQSAFVELHSFTERAIGKGYRVAIRSALLKITHFENERRLVIGAATILSYPLPNSSSLKDIDTKTNSRLNERCDEVLRIVQGYVDRHAADPVVAGRLSWLLDQFPTKGTPENDVSRRLWKGIEGIMSNLPAPTKAPPKVETERIRWNGTAALFGQLIHDLADKNYLAAPLRAGKPNWSAVARILHTAFDIRKEGGEPVTLAALTQALKPEGDRDIIGGKAAFKITPRKG